MAEYLESRESSSPIITRAVAAGLQGQYANPYEFDSVTKALLKIVGYFPQSVAQYMVPRAQNSNALDASIVQKLDVDDLVRARVKDYEQVKGPFPAITMGVGMGGTTAHLALSLGGPFLPQAYVLTLNKGSMDGNVQNYFDLSAETARIVTEKNPGVMSIQHYDPIHDGWLTRRVNHLRLKLITMSDVYQEYIRKNLQPGGEIIYLDGGAKWKQYQVGPKNVFQVGGWGDISAEEFLYGSDRIRAYCKKEGMKYANWQLDGYPLIDGPESEWGSEPGLGESIEAFCIREGYQFTRIAFDDPNQFNILAYKAVEKQLSLAGREPAGTLVEVFSQYDASAVLRSGLVPLWLIFNTNDSAEFLARMAKVFKKDKPVFFSPLSTFSITPDLVPWENWEKALNGINWINIGTRKSHYPADTWTVVDWQKPLQDWCKKHEAPITNLLDGKTLAGLAREVKSGSI